MQAVKDSSGSCLWRSFSLLLLKLLQGTQLFGESWQACVRRYAVFSTRHWADLCLGGGGADRPVRGWGGGPTCLRVGGLDRPVCGWGGWTDLFTCVGGGPTCLRVGGQTNLFAGGGAD